ncbi:hypothetical protein ACOZ0W_004407 [Cronobacter dublinensis]
MQSIAGNNDVRLVVILSAVDDALCPYLLGNRILSPCRQTKSGDKATPLDDFPGQSVHTPMVDNLVYRDDG